MKTNHRKWIGLGYVTIIMLISIIGYRWHEEWNDIEKLEIQNRQIDEFRKEINSIHIRFIEFSLSGETVLEWDDEDLENYHTQRMAMDSLFCRFKAIYPAERIDSVRHLLEDKELQMRRIVQVLDEQQVLNEKIARQVPVIVQEKCAGATQETETERISRHIRQEGKAKANRDHNHAPFAQSGHDSRATGAKTPSVGTRRQPRRP